MARKSGRGGFKAAKNYDPRRNKRSVSKRTSNRQPEQPGQQGLEARAEYDRLASKPRADRTKKDVAERIEAKMTHPNAVQNLSFADLGVGNNLIRVLEELGAGSPFPIQAVTIPDAIAGRNVLGRAKTGSGKTIAFGVAVIERLMQQGKKVTREPARKPRALILAPTRELALQIDRTVQPLARSVGLFTTQIVGGLAIASQTHALKRGVDIVIGTPGRVEDLLRRGKLDLREMLVSVVDEADHMADLGFIEPVQRILRQVKSGGQTMLFSATLDEDARELVAEFMPNHVAHEIVADRSATMMTNHAAFVVMREDKIQILTDIVKNEKRVLVFTRTRAFAETLAAQLSVTGVKATSLHGDLSQQRRLRNLETFTSGKATVLVATDVAARGIHVDNVDLVVQADPPEDYKAYLHRAGRTGRAGKRGLVVTLVPRTRQKFNRSLLRDAEIDAVYFGECSPKDTARLMKEIKKKQ